MPAPAVTAIHHHCPPNQLGSESAYQLSPNPTTPMNTRLVSAPKTPRAIAYAMRTQNSRRLGQRR